MLTSSPRSGTRSNSPVKPIIEVDLTAEDDDDNQDVSVIKSTRSTRRTNKGQNKLDESLEDMSNVGNQSVSSSNTTPTGGHEEDSQRSPGARSNARCVELLVVARHAQRYRKSCWRVSRMHTLW